MGFAPSKEAKVRARPLGTGAADDHMASAYCSDLYCYLASLRDRYQLLQQVENYQVELTAIRQGQTEKLTDYADRIMKVLSKLSI